MSGPNDDIKKERERFVAFAFAAAEIFLEIDALGQVLFESGAADKLSSNGRSLLGTPLFDRVYSEDSDILMALMDHLDYKGRIGPMPIRFKLDDGDIVALRLFGLRMPGREKRTFLSLRSAPLSSLADSGATDTATGLLTRDGFMELAAKTMQNFDGPLFMTAISIEGIQESRKKFGSRHAERLLKRISAHLKTLSADGMSAGQIGESEFAFLHRQKGDADYASKSIEDAGKDSDLKAVAATIAADQDLGEGEVIRTLTYVLSKFCENPDGCTFTSVADAYDIMAGETQKRVNTMRHMIETGSFKMAFQPVVSLQTGDIHHHEVLSRFTIDGREESPQNIIRFAEDVGIIEEFDLSLCVKAIDYIRKMRRLGSHVDVSLNLSGRTLESGRLRDALADILIGAQDISRSIVLELTETKAIEDFERVQKLLAEFKTSGFQICLDDFGVGAAGYQYLRAFDVDMVKISGEYVREMGEATYRPTFLLSMVRLCDDLGVKTVGEHVETRFQADFLKSLGVKYGQGYYFGRPTFSPKVS